MTEYYKLVRPNFTSFHDPSFKWPITGTVEATNAVADGACGPGLHLARTVNAGLRYAKFPFRILKVRPLSPVLGEDNFKIRVAKAESFGELPIPAWAKKIEKLIAELPEEMKAIPWFNGNDQATAKKLIRSHFKRLVLFGFKLDFDIEIITERKDAVAAWKAGCNAPWDAARDVSRDVARDVAMDAAMDAVWDAAMDAVWDAAMDAAWDTAWGAARNAANDTAMDAARDTAWGAARDAARDVARDVARDAARNAAWNAADDLLEHPNPFKPLWECWKTGAWPIGFVNNKFKLFVPRGKRSQYRNG